MGYRPAAFGLRLRRRPVLNKVERTIELESQGGLGRFPRPDLLAPVMTQVHGSLQDAVRMAFLHKSRPKGRIAQPLAAAADARFVGVSNGQGDGTTRMVFLVPTFESVAPALFEQQALWPVGPRPQDTAFEVFGSALHAVAQRDPDSSTFDSAMLRRLQRYRRALKQGVTRIGMPDTSEDRRGWIDKGVLDSASALSSLTPEPRRVRVAGRVDVMGASQALLKLDISPRDSVTAIWEGTEDVTELREWFGRDVVLEGVAVFRPSGSLLRIDADAIASATDSDAFFRTVPKPVLRQEYARATRLRPGESSAFLQLRGFLPGDESDDEFEAALADLG